MTTRINSITLVLAKDTRIDDAEALISACKQFGGVIDVVPNVCDDWSALSERLLVVTKLSHGFCKLLEGLNP